MQTELKDDKLLSYTDTIKDHSILLKLGQLISHEITKIVLVHNTSSISNINELESLTIFTSIL